MLTRYIMNNKITSIGANGFAGLGKVTTLYACY